MGYSITFKPNEEQISGYKKSMLNQSMLSIPYVKELSIKIAILCLKDNTNDILHSNLFFDVDLLLSSLYNAVRDDTRNNVYCQWKNNGEIMFSGWEYANECDLDKEFFISNTLEKLMILAFSIKTPDFFENEENFLIKKEKIDELIDNFIQDVNDLTIHEIIDDLTEKGTKIDNE